MYIFNICCYIIIWTIYINIKEIHLIKYGFFVLFLLLNYYYDLYILLKTNFGIFFKKVCNLKLFKHNIGFVNYLNYEHGNYE